MTHYVILKMPSAIFYGFFQKLIISPEIIRKTPRNCVSDPTS